MNGPIYSLDRTDLKILDILQTDGRISNSKLAELVNLSPTAVMARVQKLTKDEFILGYEAKLNPGKLNANFLVFVEVLLDKTTPNVLDDFIDAVTQYPEIVECHMVSGGFDFLIKLRCSNMEEFRRISGQILWQLPGVKETRSYPVMQVVKDSSKIKIKSKTKF
ncbi:MULTISPECIES: Lrp/AsnC ligand binding domain-containing protein [Acinetobacter]|uniref:Leucine-responsive regulatory protein n=1 Tax=Acinetobacter thutiue TaxID=2998078 RepID=A0ABT7WL04_9GAMM|nr:MULTISPECIES: Lrp/AsnC ligand binding domain-containing protein [Acinetobacter]MCY6411238.1 Lrp/AsnC ligand binding domain-containing protein [Acinetobacter thutiue]MDH0031380.1 Lrp/AsnC ligand binding domain-containing protein [Acinetobacter sp. GD04021]MDH0887135.1 Lrp/AsnC ligand binding domain-containing protein [Acinetobacter sp. GD03873]MDH1083576.1 Lrp/AsnC ligand binding domain-containing protein [Acinetobacter sp. GD03983]MDH2190451.1 Lrp/AsnC ligand binding domain-containing prote